MNTKQNPLLPSHIAFTANKKSLLENGVALGIHVTIFPTHAAVEEDYEPEQTDGLPEYIAYRIEEVCVEKIGNRNVTMTKSLGNVFRGDHINTFIDKMSLTDNNLNIFFLQDIKQDIANYLEEHAEEQVEIIEDLKGNALSSKELITYRNSLMETWQKKNEFYKNMDPSFVSEPFDPCAIAQEVADDNRRAANDLRQAVAYFIIKKEAFQRVPENIRKNNGNFELQTHILFRDQALPEKLPGKDIFEFQTAALTGIHFIYNKPELDEGELFDHQNYVFDTKDPENACLYVIEYMKNEEHFGSIEESLANETYFTKSPLLFFPYPLSEMIAVVRQEENPIDCLKSDIIEQIAEYKKLMTERVESLTKPKGKKQALGQVVAFRSKNTGEEPPVLPATTGKAQDVASLDAFKTTKVDAAEEATDIMELGVADLKPLIDFCSRLEEQLPNLRPLVLDKRDFRLRYRP